MVTYFLTVVNPARLGNRSTTLTSAVRNATLDFVGALSFMVGSFNLGRVMAESAKPKRRMVKKAETVREKTEKAGLPKPDKKSGVLRLTLGYIALPFRWIGRQFAKLGRFLGKFRVLRFIGKILWPTYFRESWKELRQVTWPSRSETWKLTLAVILFAVIFGLLVSVVDFGLDKIFRKLILE